MSYLNSPGYYVQRELHERDLAANADCILIQTIHTNLAQCYADLAREAQKVPGWGARQALGSSGHRRGPESRAPLLRR